MTENLFDDFALPRFDKGDPLHFTPTVGTEQRVLLVSLHDQSRPFFAGLPGGGRSHRRSIFLGLPQTLRPFATLFIRIPPVITDQVFFPRPAEEP